MLTPTPRRRSDGAKPAQEPKIQAVSQATEETEAGITSHEKAQKGTKSSGAASLAPLPSVQNGSGSDLVVAGNRAADIVAFERQVVGFFVDAADLLGVPKSVAAIYGICFASPEPLSFSDIDERLDISSGSISQGLRVLKEVGALKVAEEASSPGSAQSLDGSLPQSLSIGGNGENGGAGHESSQSLSPSLLQSLGRRRADRYAPDLELRKLILRWLENRLQNELKSGQSRLKTIIESIPQSLENSDTTLRTRFESLQTWHDKASSLLPIAKTFLKLT